MGDDARAGSSLLQTQAEKVHRERINNHQHNIHNALHRRQAAAASESEATTTVAVIQQIVVDSSGITIGTVMVTASPSISVSLTVPAIVPPPVVAPAAPLTTPPPASVSPTLSTTGLLAAGATGSNSVTDISITSTPQSLPSGQASSLTSALSLTSKTGIGANSSIPTSSTSSFRTPNLFSNQTLSSTLTVLKSKSGSESSYSTTLYSTASVSGTQLVATAPHLSTSTDAAGNVIIVGGQTVTGGSSPASTTASGGSDGGSSGDSTIPPTPVLVGGVVGGIAGAAFVVLVLLFLLRWHKRSRAGLLSLNTGDGSSTGAITSRDGGDPSQSGGMVQRSIPFAIPAALASLTGRNKRASHAQSASSTAGSERGFYRVSGRKLPSVLQSGGDGYGASFDDRPMFSNSDTLSGTSFYRDSQGFHGGPGIGMPSDRDSGIPIMRPGPARTPVTQQGAFTPPAQHSPFGNSPFDSPPPPLRRPDGLGRSHPSQDGSHGSRFTEELS